MDISAVFREFITLFVVFDPIGSVPVFLFATKYVPRACGMKKGDSYEYRCIEW